MNLDSRKMKMTETQILVVTRQPAFAMLLRNWLEEAGHAVLHAFDGPQGLRECVRHRPAFVILDMPTRRDSFDLLTRIRELSEVPVILLSARASEADKVQGLALGADDYLVKPVGPLELLARIEAILRRAGRSAAAAGIVYKDGAITVDFARHIVYVQGAEVSLTVLEYNLLACLIRHAGQVVPQRKLLEQVWGPEYGGCEYVKWHVGHLRRKIEEDPLNPRLIVTVRGIGYRYDVPSNGANGTNGHMHPLALVRTRASPG
jgi:DNA-binding response OmpR family regulator